MSMLASSAVDRGFKPWSGQTKDYKIGICCFSAKHAALRRKSKDWLARNKGKRFTICTEIAIILGTVWFTIRGGRLRYKRYDAHFLKKVELNFRNLLLVII